MAENNMEKPKNKNFANTASRISAIASSVMDLHVRIALQEVDREKRRLISGGIFLAIGIKSQLFEIIDSIRENNWEISEKIEPFESQLEELLEELNNTLRPKIESPIRKKPLLSIAIAAGIGLLIGTLLNSGRK